MITRTKLLILTIFIPMIVYSQEPGKISKGDILVKLSPLSMLPTTMPFLELGTSYQIFDKHGIQLKYGKKLDFYNPNDIYKNDGFKLTLEYMFFLKRRIYVSLEGGYLKGKYSDNMDYYDSELRDNVIRDSFVASTEKTFISPKVGFILFLSENIIVDFYGGVGLQHHVRQITELEFDSSQGHEWTDYTEWGFAPNYEEIDENQPRLTLGFNINYRF